MLGPGRAHTTINQPTPYIQQGKCTAWLLCLSMLQRISSRKTLVVGKKYVRGLPSNILMKISSLKWCQSRKPAGWFCIISISNFGWSHLFSLQSLGSVGCACPSELSSLGAPGSPMAKGHCSQCERALCSGHGRGFVSVCLALSPEAWLGKGQERACGLAWPKLELLHMRVKEYGQLEESAPCKPSPSSVSQISPDVPYFRLLWLPPIAGWNFLHRKIPY